MPKVTREQVYKKLNKLLPQWREMAENLKKESEILHEEFVRTTDQAKLKKILSRLEKIEE